LKLNPSFDIGKAQKELPDFWYDLVKGGDFHGYFILDSETIFIGYCSIFSPKGCIHLEKTLGGGVNRSKGVILDIEY
jgi:hypothetical protein